jgi:cobalt-zinc-cadmium efflux system outer membrane protein
MRRILTAFIAALCGATAVVAQDIPSSLSLADALRLAAERNPSFAAARNGIEVAQADRVTAARLPNPAFTFVSEGQSVFRSPASDGHEYVFRIDQDIDLPGRRRLRTQSADRSIDISKALYQEQWRRVELDVRRAYFQVVLAKADRDLSTAALDEIDRVITLNRARFDQGEISGGDLRRLQVERLRFQDDVLAAELALRNARATILTLLNSPDLSQPIDAVDSLAVSAPDFQSVIALAGAATPSGPTPVTSFQQAGLALVGQALAVRPDMQAARIAQQRAETETRLQRALRNPLPTIGAGYKDNAGNSRLVFGVTLSLPLFNQNQGGVARAEAEQRMAANRVRAAQRQVALEVQQALNTVEISRERVRYIEREYLKNAREALDIVLASYRLGAANLIDLLDAQRAFRDTSKTYNRALYEQRISLTELGAAIGASTGVR